MKGHKIQKQYGCSALFEISVDTNGYNFLVIFGKHISGYYCAIPNWNLCCEMSEACDTYYNYERLSEAIRKTNVGLEREIAKELAEAIKEYYELSEEQKAELYEKSIIELMEEQIEARSRVEN